MKKILMVMILDSLHPSTLSALRHDLYLVADGLADAVMLNGRNGRLHEKPLLRSSACNNNPCTWGTFLYHNREA